MAFTGALLCGMLVAVALIFGVSRLMWRPQHITGGQVVTTRITIIGISSGAHGGSVRYRGEAQVAYTVDGRNYLEWLPATASTVRREWIAAELVHRTQYADVLWTRDPAIATAILHSDPGKPPSYYTPP